MTDPTRTYRQLCAVVAAGAVAAVSVLLFPIPPRHEARASAVFSIALHSPRDGAAQVYADLGGGFAERLSSRVAFKAGSRFVRHTFALPAGKIEGLRFDPCDDDSVVTLGPAEMRDENGRVLATFSPDDFVPGQQIARLERHGDELIVHVTPGAHDPSLLLKLRTPLELSGAISPEDRRAEKHRVTVERSIASALLVSGFVLAILLGRGISKNATAAAPGHGLELASVAWAGFCVLFSRRPDVIACPQFWAEDGTVFFAQQHALGWKSALLTHGGYLHLIPRLTAGLASLTGPLAAPALYLSAALIVVLIAIVKTTSRRVALPYPYWCALAIVLAPNMDEIAFNVTNAQWFGAIVLVLVALSRPPLTRAGLAGDVAAVIAFGLSGPFSVFFLPLFIARAVRWRARAVIGTTVLVGLMAALQVNAYLHSSAPPATGATFSFGQALAAIGYRTGGQFLNVLPPPLVSDPVPWGACALAPWLLLWLALPVPRDFRTTRAVLFAAALLVLAGGLWRYRETVDVFFNRIHVQRYVHLPLVATGWLLLAALAHATGWRKAAIIGGMAVLLARNAPWYRVSPNFDYHWPIHAAAIARGERLEAPINPAGWVLTLPARPPE